MYLFSQTLSYILILPKLFYLQTSVKSQRSYIGRQAILIPMSDARCSGVSAVSEIGGIRECDVFALYQMRLDPINIGFQCRKTEECIFVKLIGP